MLHDWNNSVDNAYSVVMPKPFAILLVLAVLVQSLFGAVAGAGAGTICLGGGHEYSAVAETSHCDMDCSHASGHSLLPAWVQEAHADCSCSDLDLSISKLLAPIPSQNESAIPELMSERYELPLVLVFDGQPKRLLPLLPSWFDPGAMRCVSDLSTTRLIV